jgi:SAM-dependent methyltransferase
MPAGNSLSRDFYARLGAEGLRGRTRPDWDAAITELVAGYIGRRERVLDLGCGYGRIAIPLAARGYRVIGLDLAEGLLRSGQAEARAQGVRLPLAAGSMSRLPFSDASFDSVICLWSAFYEVLDPADQVQTLAEMVRVLGRGGLALIEGPLRPGPHEELPTGRIRLDTVEGLPNAGYIHDADTLGSRCAEAGVSGAEIFVRDWAGRDRMIVTFERAR